MRKFEKIEWKLQEKYDKEKFLVKFTRLFKKYEEILKEI